MGEAGDQTVAHPTKTEIEMGRLRSQSSSQETQPSSTTTPKKDDSSTPDYSSILPDIDESKNDFRKLPFKGPHISHRDDVQALLGGNVQNIRLGLFPFRFLMSSEWQSFVKKRQVQE